MCSAQARRPSSPSASFWVAFSIRVFVLLSVLLLASVEFSDSLEYLAPLLVRIGVCVLERLRNVLRFLAITTTLTVVILNSHWLSRDTSKDDDHAFLHDRRQRMHSSFGKQVTEQEARASYYLCVNGAYAWEESSGMLGRGKCLEGNELKFHSCVKRVEDVNGIDAESMVDADVKPAIMDVDDVKLVMNEHGGHPELMMRADVHKMKARVDADVKMGVNVNLASGRPLNTANADACAGTVSLLGGGNLGADASFQGTTEPPCFVHPMHLRSKSVGSLQGSQQENALADLQSSKAIVTTAARRGRISKRGVASLSCDLGREKHANSQLQCPLPSPPTPEVLKAYLNDRLTSVTGLEEATSFIESLVPWRASPAIKTDNKDVLLSPIIINNNNVAINSCYELGKKADAFIARFQQKMKLQRAESLERQKLEMLCPRRLGGS